MARKRKLRGERNTAVVLTGFFVVAFAGCFMLNASADYIADGNELGLNSSYSYNIITSFDGVDLKGTASNGARKADLFSDRIYVTSQIPHGMIFDKFGDAALDDQCKGKAVDFAYDEDSRTISYSVEGLQAGCNLSVGVVLRTPKTVEDEDASAQVMRRDFYAQAEATEDGVSSVRSNIAHSFVGNDIVPLYKVSYEYTGDIPYGAPKLPDQIRHTKGSFVEKAPLPAVPGYTFSGWSAGSITEEKSDFIMPGSDITLTGTFVKNSESSYYNVRYRVDGDKPANYIVPAEKTVAPGSLFTLDKMTKDYASDDYSFSGWMSADVELDEQGFVMPSHDVEIVGNFYPLHPIEEATENNISSRFAVTYKPNLPAGCKDYNTSPAQKSYAAGSAVHISSSKPICEGYTFKGWQLETDTKIKYINEDYFEMPSEDITLRAVWSKINIRVE